MVRRSSPGHRPSTSSYGSRGNGCPVRRQGTGRGEVFQSGVDCTAGLPGWATFCSAGLISRIKSLFGADFRQRFLTPPSPVPRRRSMRARWRSVCRRGRPITRALRHESFRKPAAPRRMRATDGRKLVRIQRGRATVTRHPHGKSDLAVGLIDLVFGARNPRRPCMTRTRCLPRAASPASFPLGDFPVDGSPRSWCARPACCRPASLRFA
ncbi:hypothetical protein PAN31108_03471 [Pandoraea anhela]|uniref:Uncharacterized protein n=1 Tax=Pandoraea anhela TaxID=2508295 RepID=A0A5E4WVF3_9BURK|nr:hypothetical protein PAN31108_03471 [Pandoraea anhela]